MPIWGTRTYLRSLAIVTFVCNHCHTPAANRVSERVSKFTLFFIPLFPFSTKYFATCTYCGNAIQLTKDEADSYVAHAAAVENSQRQQQGWAQNAPQFQQGPGHRPQG